MRASLCESPRKGNEAARVAQAHLAGGV